jgi:hypothetical protein
VIAILAGRLRGPLRLPIARVVDGSVVLRSFYGVTVAHARWRARRWALRL